MEAPPSAGDEQAPPHDLAAEEYVLGAMMLSSTAIDAVRPILRVADFYRDSHRWIYAAMLDLNDIGVPVDALLTADELDARGRLQLIGGNEGVEGGRERIRELATLVPATTNAAHHAAIVRRKAGQRQQQIVAFTLTAATRNGGLEDNPALRIEIREMLESAENAAGERSSRSVRDGAEFIFDSPAETVSIWGIDQQIAWAQGEALMLAGPQGVGKTTVAQQLILARIGIRSRVLGWPVTESPRPVLYLALDRPAQVARSLARMVNETHRETLRERLRVWAGPLPFNLKDDPAALLNFTRAQGCGTVVIDSLKDLVPELSKEPDSYAVNQARQYLLAAGIETLELHHQRKATSDNKIPNTISDIYGNQALTAGTGSILLLWGQPGDPVILLKHLKQPAEQIAPHDLIHNHLTGITFLEALPDLLAIARTNRTDGITARDAAQQLYRTDDPDRNQIERARRRLQTLAQADKLVEIPGHAGPPKTAAIWVYNGNINDVDQSEPEEK